MSNLALGVYHDTATHDTMKNDNMKSGIISTNDIYMINDMYVNYYDKAINVVY
jgi:hypothetical protein